MFAGVVRRWWGNGRNAGRFAAIRDYSLEIVDQCRIIIAGSEDR